MFQHSPMPCHPVHSLQCAHRHNFLKKSWGIVDHGGRRSKRQAPCLGAYHGLTSHGQGHMILGEDTMTHAITSWWCRDESVHMQVTFSLHLGNMSLWLCADAWWMQSSVGRIGHWVGRISTEKGQQARAHRVGRGPLFLYHPLNMYCCNAMHVPSWGVLQVWNWDASELIHTLCLGRERSQPVSSKVWASLRFNRTSVTSMPKCPIAALIT